MAGGTVVRARRHRWAAPGQARLRFPLDGEWYVGQGGGPLLNHHARVAEQRGAIDLVQVDRRGTRIRGGRRQDPGAYLAWDAPVHAPCNGRIVSAVDGLEDQAVGQPRYGPPAGNHVAIDAGGDVVLLAHLRRGSVLVRTGDVVQAGQPVGRVGNSGNTTQPHLHVHLHRDGQGLDLAFDDVPGPLFRGRTVRRHTARANGTPGPG